MKALYSISGTITLIGVAATLYGISTSSFPMFIEGVFLTWLGFTLTTNMIEAQAH